MTVLYIAGIAKLAAITGAEYILFPELGALSKDIFTRPQGKWAKAPVLLMLTPLLTAVGGVFIAQNMVYAPLSVLLCVATGIVVIAALRSPIAPAISAGLLPLTFDIHSWWYPLSITLGTAALAGITVIRNRYGHPSTQTVPTDVVDDALELAPSRYGWVPFFVACLAVDVWLGQLTGWRAVLVPPLVVMGFEMFAHSEICPWADRPIILPLVCSLTAAVGVLAAVWLGTGPLAAAAAVAGGIVIIKGFDVHVPPAIAISLLPLLIEHPTFRYPLAVGLGTIVLTGSFLLYRFVSKAVSYI